MLDDVGMGHGRRQTSAIAIVGLSAVLCAGCSSDVTSGAPGSTAGSGQKGDPSQRSTGGRSSGPMGSSLASAVPRAALAGTWRADFEAKKGAVTLDPGVGVPAWKNDDGSKAVGRGSLELTVAADGTVSGKLSGALGVAAIRGAAEDEQLTATFTPADDSVVDEQAMAGTLIVQRKGEALVGSLRASSGDAKLVRMASLELSRAGTP